MADFEDAKNSRSLAKRGITTAAKRLIGACFVAQYCQMWLLRWQSLSRLP